MTKRTQLSYLDLEAFYLSAKSLWSFAQSGYVGGKSVKDICEKLTCVIDAIRADGLDPRWNPERDALRDVLNNLASGIKPEYIIEHLHQRGYKIVKEAGLKIYNTTDDAS